MCLSPRQGIFPGEGCPRLLWGLSVVEGGIYVLLWPWPLVQLNEEQGVFLLSTKEGMDSLDKVEPQKSSSLRVRMVEHKMEMEDKEFDTVWTSCCLRLDKRAKIHFTQITIFFLVIPILALGAAARNVIL